MSRLFATLWTAARQVTVSITNSRSLLKLCPSSQWCHPAISSSVIPFSSCLQPFPASVFFPVSQIFASGGQSIGVSASSSVLPMNIQDWFPLGSPCSPKDSQESSTPQFKSINSSAFSFFFYSLLSHPYMTGKTIALTRRTFVGKVMSLLFNMLSRLVITFLPRSKHRLISWLLSPSVVILEPPQNKVCHCFHCFPIYLPSWSDGTRCHDLKFSERWVLSQLFHSLFHFHQEAL